MRTHRILGAAAICHAAAVATVIIVMFFRERTGTWELPRVPVSIAVALLLTILGVFYLGLFPGRVFSAFQAKPTISVRMR